MTNGGAGSLERHHQVPGGPWGARQKIETDFLDSLQRKWAANGDSIVDKAALQDPVAFLNVMAKVLPKELAISVEQRTPGNLAPEAYATLRRVLDLIERCKVQGDPESVFAKIEAALRADAATLIEAKCVSTTPQFWKIIVDLGILSVILFP